MKVEHLKFDTPLKKEYRRQTKLKANETCRHLKGIEYIEKLDHENDEVYQIACCDVCGKELSELDLKNRDIILKKYDEFQKRVY